MKITIPPNLKGKELTIFLLANKEAIISEKKAMPMKYSDPFLSDVTVKEFLIKTGAIKDDSTATEDPTDSEKIHVKVVANSTMVVDSQFDLLIPGCYKRTVKERKGKFVHLHDHIYKIDAKIGEVTDVYTEDLMFSQLGIDKAGSCECLIFETDVYKSYNQQIFNQYKYNKVNQHSIGLQYVTIDIAINDGDSQKEFALWNKWIDQIVNKEDAIRAGFFFVVSEIKLLENSCVLFASNFATPTLEVGKAAKTAVKDDSGAGTSTAAENSEAITYIDQLSKRHKKSIKIMDDCIGDDECDDAELMEHCNAMKSEMQSHLIKMQEIKDNIVNGKTHPAPDIQKEEQAQEPVIEPTIEAIDLDVIKSFTFLN